MTVRTSLRVLVLALGVISAACTGPAGKDGTSCSLTTASDGTKTLSCTDGTSIVVTNGKDGVDGKTCTVAENTPAAGQTTITCTDGTSAVVSNGSNGTDGTSCTSTPVDGGVKITCPDGTSTVISNGTNGTDAQNCSVVSNSDGTRTITCPDGTTVTVRNALVDYAAMSATDRLALNMSAVINTVTIGTDGKPVVSFKIADSNGNGVKGMPAADMRFALLKLTAGVNGSANDTWVSYMAANATSTASTEATAANVEDLGDGTYRYTFAKVITDSANAGTTYDAAAVHKLVIIINESGNPFLPINAVKEFIPSTGADVTGQNDKVDPASCLECHSSFRGKAAFHGGARYDPRICVACHNDQRRFTTLTAGKTVDLDASGVVQSDGTWVGNAALVNGEAFINLPVFIHKIHMGEDLTLNGGTYTAVSAPYETTFPQDIRNCTKCHRNVAKADNWKSVPSRRACGSCHDGVSFKATASIPAGRTAHQGGAYSNDTSCATTCHVSGGMAGAIDEKHFPIADPNPAATSFGGTNANTNSGWVPAAGKLPAGAAKITYDLKSVSRDGTTKNPVMVFRFIKDGTPVVFNDKANATELMDGFVNSPSLYFVWAVPQDGIAKPVDFNVSTYSWLKNLWNGTATGTSAGTLTFDSASGYYTAMLTGVVVPDNAVMFTGGIGYTYSLSSTPPLTQVNLDAFPYTLNATTNKYVGGLVVAAPDVWKVATGYTARRQVVATSKCLSCHEQLGANPSFHAGQRNDAPTCSFCHNTNRVNHGWAVNVSTFIHGIHGASKRTVPFTWEAPSATDNYSKVTYPGILNNCEQCHVANGYDFSMVSGTTNDAPSPNLLWSTTATGTYNLATDTAPYMFSPYVDTTGTVNYGSGFSYAVATGITTQAAATTLVNSPVASACVSCHDNAIAKTHMTSFGGQLYVARSTVLDGNGVIQNPEQCLMCHGKGKVAAIADVHK